MAMILVRHGQTDANAAGLLQGRADLPLNDRGRLQADACARVLAPLIAGGAAIVSSPLRRALQTAEHIAGGKPVEIDPSWIEIDYGSLEQVHLHDVSLETWEKWRTDIGFVPAGGESVAAVGERVRRACDGLFELAQAGDVIVVSHVTPIKAAVGWALRVGDETSWHMQLDQASITRVRCARGEVALRSFNDTCHLD